MPKLRKHPTYDFTVMSNKMYRDRNLKAMTEVSSVQCCHLLMDGIFQ